MRYPPTTAAKTEFLSALREWSGRLADEFPTAAPPCNAVGSFDEDALLARVFARVAMIDTYRSTESRGSILAMAVVVHERRYQALLDSARGSHPPHIADRSTWSQTRPYAAMVETLRLWLDALYDQSLGLAA